MARPRKYIQVNGRTIDGASLHRSTARYYIFGHRGKQQYLRDWRDASAVYQSRLAAKPIDCIGDVRIGSLTPEHFRKFHSWVDKEATKRSATRWHGQAPAAYWHAAATTSSSHGNLMN